MHVTGSALLVGQRRRRGSCRKEGFSAKTGECVCVCCKSSASVIFKMSSDMSLFNPAHSLVRTPHIGSSVVMCLDSFVDFGNM